jgi:hypothetical protein
MAKHLVRPAPILVLRKGGKFRRAAHHVGGLARRGVASAHRSAPTVGIALGAAAVGYATGKGYLNKLPALAGSHVLTLGLIGFAATRFVRNQHVRNAGLAALAAAAFDFGRSQATGVSGIDGDDTSGTDNGGQF